MIYLSGVTNDRDEPALIAAGAGLILNPGNGYHHRVDRYPWWGAENGCFAEKWAEGPWLDWLDRLPRERCLFAVAPDVYPDAAATLARSRRYFALVREMGFPVALVAQDGAETLELPWDDFDCLFIGGERTPNPRHEWKVSSAAEALGRRARAAGKWLHMGRVNSLYRIERAREMGCHSVDGTFLKYWRRPRARDVGPRPSMELDGWMEWLEAHPVLWTFEGPALAVHREASA